MNVRCCIVGGGPAGMMTGFLLARAGVDVLLLEKHADFLRDFRGDTVHPSTLELMYELGILKEFLQQPHQELSRVAVQIRDTKLWVGDFTHLPTHAKFIALMPQWDFLNFLAERGRVYPEFQLRMQAECMDLLQQDGVVKGVRVKTTGGELTVHSDLVIATDGRHSIVREKAGLTVRDKGAPMDVLWIRLSRRVHLRPSSRLAIAAKARLRLRCRCIELHGRWRERWNSAGGIDRKFDGDRRSLRACPRCREAGLAWFPSNVVPAASARRRLKTSMSSIYVFDLNEWLNPDQSTMTAP
ncbi:MAG: hypothetical protein DMG63_10875 [Acidobacteria bacterium]|nr:MAG: hypothetical protein DMG63_10875 [Acidobacteriota bacterium]